MNTMQLVNRVCYTICVVCILAATTFGLVLVWTNVDPEFARKSLLTVIIIFLASLMTIGVNRVLIPPRA